MRHVRVNESAGMSILRDRRKVQFIYPQLFITTVLPGALMIDGALRHRQVFN